jgi:hypothetical protein
LKKRRAIERLACDLCGQAGEAPCVHRVTGKPIKGWHSPRARAGIHDAIKADLHKLDGMGETFYMWVWMHFGLKQNEYPVGKTQAEWDEIYRMHPEVDPSNQYNSEW